MRPKITINVRKAGVLLSGLSVGSFFRFPASAEGTAYMVIGFDTDATRYVQLDTSENYTSAIKDGKRVNRLCLLSAEFALMEKR